MIHLKTFNKNWQKLLLLVAIPLFSVIGIIAAGVNVSAADDEAFDSAINGAAKGVKDAVNTSGEEVHYFNVQVGTSAYTETCVQNLLSDTPEYSCENSTPTKEVSTIRLTQQGGKYYISRVSNPDDGAGATLSKGTKVSVKGVKFAIIGNKLLNISFDGGTQRKIHVNLKKDMKKTRQDFRAKTSKTIEDLLCPVQPFVISFNGSTMTNYCSYTFTPDSKVTTVKLTNADTNEDVDEDSDSEAVKKTCMNSGGANTLGWIVCPILDWMSSASQTLYEGFLEPALQVNPKLFADGPNDGTRVGWEFFRNIANTVFIILLILVIFSQLTGVGIDNYGIKKILPKLIIAAILINLSYWICVIFVDISNIVGNSIQEIFATMGNGLTLNSDAYEIDLASSIGSTALTAVAILGITAVGIWSVVSPEGIGGLLLVLLVAAISVVVSLFFLFILLAAREAAIVVLTVVSPLAFVLYMLPNTKSIFDKWWKLGEALLLVYPIAGFLVGGGNFVSQLLLVAGAGSGSFFSVFVAMIVGVVPIFFIPTVLKNSFQGLGNIGAKISGLSKTAGSKLSGATRKTAEGSNALQRFTNAADMRSPFKRVRANAVAREGARMANQAKINRLSDRGNMATRMAAIAAAEDAKAIDEATAQRLSLMQSSGEGGGIKVADSDGNIIGTSPYTLGNMDKRMRQLEELSRRRALSSEETLEMSALARGMASEKGGAGMLGKIIRNAQNGSGGANSNFMNAMGKIYANDGSVQSKMREKDAGASIYTEQFMENGSGAGGGLSFDDYKGYTNGAGVNEYASEMGNRVKSHAVGLNQSGAAIKEYLDTLDASPDAKDLYQEIMDDENLLNSLDVGDREEVKKRASLLGVEGKSAREVNVTNELNVSGNVQRDGSVDIDIRPKP